MSVSKAKVCTWLFQVLGHNESLGTPVSYGPTIHSVQQNVVSQKLGLT